MRFFSLKASSPSRYFSQTTDQKIHKFKNLPIGWHYGTGISPSADTITLSLRINNQAVLTGLGTDAFPGVDGEIQVNCYSLDDTIEFIIEHDGKISLVHDRRNIEIESLDSLELSDALDFLKKYRNELWNLSDFSTQITTTSTEKDLSAWRSKTPLMAAEYQLYQSPV